MDHTQVCQSTARWISSVVVDLNLCPFARRVVDGRLIRFFVSELDDEKGLLGVLTDELIRLYSTPITEVETAVLIFPNAFPDFRDFNDFVGEAEQCVADLKFDGVFQVVGFHPKFLFADTLDDSAENYTNRSPFPMLHLLRESSVTEAVGNSDDMDEIPRRNIELLNRLGQSEMDRRLRACEEH